MPKTNVPPTFLSQSFDQLVQRRDVIVDPGSEHGPVDPANDVLHSHARIARTEVHVLVDYGKDQLPIAVCGVQLARAEPRVDVLLGDDGDEGPAVVQSFPDGAVPVGTGGDVVRVQPHADAMALEVALELHDKLCHFGLPTVA